MRNLSRAVMGFVVMAIPSIAAGQAYKLSPTCTPGMHWQVNWDNTGRLRTMDSPVGVMNAPGFLQERGKAEFTVVEAADGRFKVMEIVFSKCEVQSQMPGATRASRPEHPLAGRKIHIERRIVPDTREEKFDITAQGNTLTPDIEDSIRGYYCTSPLPDRPIAIGTQWKSEHVDFLLGPKAKGEMELRFVQIENGPTGRPRAVVQMAGEAAMDFAGTGGAAGTADLSVRYGFTGKMRIDLQTGLVEGIDLSGPMRMDHGGNMGEAIVQRGDWTYRLDAARLAAVAIAPPQAADAPAVAAPGARNPLDDTGPDPFAGTFKNDRLAIELKPAAAGYTGSLHFAGKTFTVSASRKGNSLEGRFQSGADEFPFAAALDADGSMRFASGRAAHTLRKEAAANPLETAQAANPLETPQQKNPLAR